MQKISVVLVALAFTLAACSDDKSYNEVTDKPADKPATDKTLRPR